MDMACGRSVTRRKKKLNMIERSTRAIREDLGVEPNAHKSRSTSDFSLFSMVSFLSLYTIHVSALYV